MKSEAALHPFDQLSALDRRGRKRNLSAPSAYEQSPGGEGRLTLRLHPWNLMFSLQDVAELIPVPRITRVPGVKCWLLGIANLRGTVISVIDLAAFLDGAATVPTSSSRIVILRSGEWHYGLLVDEIIGLRHFGPEKRMRTLNTIDPKIRPYLTEAYRSEEQEWLVFRADQLLNDSKFLDAAN